jgi:SAM-dependent methyltransferase
MVLNSAYLNYGYVDEAFVAEPLALPEILEVSRTCIQLYHRVATQAELADKVVLEVGCGRGGGASWIAGLGPKQVFAVDLSPVAIDFCRRIHAAPSLSFSTGDAGALPFADASIDVVVNVESSHCYPSMDRFLHEVRRVLRPGGLFPWADVRFTDQLAELERSFPLSGLELVAQREITDNVVAALDQVGPLREEVSVTQVSRFLRPLVRSALAVPGTVVYNALAGHEFRYLCKLLRRPAVEEIWVDYPFDFGAEDRFNPERGMLKRHFGRTYDWIRRYYDWRFSTPR